MIQIEPLEVANQIDLMCLLVLGQQSRAFDIDRTETFERTLDADALSIAE
jgi:hypothetical protein